MRPGNMRHAAHLFARLATLLSALLALAACAGAETDDVTRAPAGAVGSAGQPVAGQVATPTLASAASGLPGPAAATELPPDVVIVTHVVQPGETLLGIALSYEVALEEIVELNNISDPARIAQGDELKIPMPAPTATPDPLGPTPTWPSPPGEINGIPYPSILVMDEATRQHAQEIFAAGQALGNNPRAFSKVGDSTIENPFFLAQFDEGGYNLADYVYLEGVIDYFAGSYARDSMAVRQGMHAWSMMDPTWADQGVCLTNEGPLACEIRLNRPAILLVRLGSNDAGVPDSFRAGVQAIIDYAIEHGVIPVLGTKADRFEGSDINNEIIRELAVENRLPLWDFDAVASTVPGKGLDIDNVHLLTFYQHDYSLPEAFQAGHALHNLSALVVLDGMWQEVLK